MPPPASISRARIGRARTTIVSGPGQNRAASRSACGVMSPAARAWAASAAINVSAELSDRPFNSYRRRTASAFRGSTASPYSVSVGYALLLAQHLGLDERFEPALQRYWLQLQRRDGYRRAMESQLAAATAQGVTTVPAPDTR